MVSNSPSRGFFKGLWRRRGGLKAKLALRENLPALAPRLTYSFSAAIFVVLTLYTGSTLLKTFSITAGFLTWIATGYWDFCAM